MSGHSRLALTGLLAFCLLIRLAFVLQVPAHDPFYADGMDYSRVAAGIAEGRGFYPPEMKPLIVYRAPGYPFALAGIYRLFGIGNFTAVRIVQCVLATSTGLLLFEIGATLAGVSAGLVALAFYAVHPFFIYHCATVAPEVLFTFFVVATYLSLFRFFADRRLREILSTGLTMGLAAVVKGTVLLTLPAAALTILFLLRHRWKRAFAAVLLLGIASFGVIAPIPLWVYHRWHEFSLILDGSGLNFWIGNSDVSARLFRAKTATEFQNIQKQLWMETLPGFDKEIETLGPAKRDAFYFELGKEQFRKNPRRSFWMMTERFKIFWRPWVHPKAYGQGQVILSALATVPLFLFGFFQLLRRAAQQQPDALFLLLSIVPITLLTGMIFNTEIRWRIPLIDTLLIIYAASALTAFATRGKRKMGASQI